MTPPRADVVVVGGGIAGAAVAIDLASKGVAVVVLEGRAEDAPIEGNVALTPHAIDALTRLDALPESNHMVTGVRVLAHGRSTEIPFPESLTGATVARRDLMRSLADSAVAAGVDWRWSTSATTPILDDGTPIGFETEDGQVGFKFAAIADGSLSHIGRKLGTSRRRTRPQGIAAAKTVPSEASDRSWLDVAIDLHDGRGETVPGMAWVFPTGTADIDMGVGVLSTYRDSDSVIISDLLDHWCEHLPGHWNVDPDDITNAPVIAGRVPLGDSVWPRTGPNWLAIGDAVAMTSPLNGAGAAAALGTARLAVGPIVAGLRNNDGLALRRYEMLLDEAYGDQLRIARLVARGLANPRFASTLTRVAVWTEGNLDLAMRLATSHGRSDRTARIERVVGQLARLVPEPPEHH
ncbi:MAG: NAD(P)/FAD-dependent oxidoreductase [Actinomycetia bacterium]|nr:NAD(P)/FAD-dependent oxidoreductase [Actinomycetes bacterium]MCP4962173.1 NAD(P)/FAD-dependent oxidoreductase [Actinomycetes bacterium]